MKYRGLLLDRFQKEAIQHLNEGRSVLVAAPTGTGKTIIADWIVEEALTTGRQVIYTAPIKALSNQKYRDYTRLYGEEQVGLVTGDLVINRHAPCLVMTTEILRNILLADEDLPDLMAVIIDEIHFLDDEERGTTWEELLIYLPSSVQVVGLSATLSNLEQFASWLRFVRDGPVAVVTEEERAVPLRFYCASVDTGILSPPEYDEVFKRRRRHFNDAARKGQEHRVHKRGQRSSQRRRPRRITSHLHIFDMLEKRNLLPYLYFLFSRREVEICARALGQTVNRCLLSNKNEQKLNQRLKQAAADLGHALDPELRQLYGKGIAFHHAGLHVQLKALVEELYEAKLLKVLYCTSTFALGINMPARTAVFDGLRKFDGHHFAPLTTRQFMQKAGRAGRRGMDDVGHVVVRMDLAEYEEARPQLDRYWKGRVEPVHSSFNLSWNSVVNLLQRHDHARIREIVDKSFLNWHLARQARRHVAEAEKIESENPDHRAQKQARRLVSRATQAQGFCWQAFQEKVSLLVQLGYLEEDLHFNAGAQILQHLQIAEILMTELVMSGLLEDLPGPQLFGVLCAVTNDLPRHVHRNFQMTRDDKRLANRIQRIRYSDPVMQAEEESSSPVVWDRNLLVVGRAWAEGSSLQEILLMLSSETDVSGDLINGFRRAKDLAGQLKEAYGQIPDRVQMLGQLIKKVSRDEVIVIG